jgi:hypothetical protein
MCHRGRDIQMAKEHEIERTRRKRGVRISELRDIIREFSSVDGAQIRSCRELAFSMLAVEQPLNIGTADIVRKKSLSRDWMLNWI